MFSKQKQNRVAGFTLIELMVVVAIIAVLTMVGLVSYMQAGKSARDSKRKTDLEAIKAALVLYRVNNGSYPPKDLTSTGYPAVLQNYISGGNVPNDPKDNSVYSYDPEIAFGSGFKTFTLSATLENGAGQQTNYQVTNP